MADLVIIAREHLRNPYFANNASLELQFQTAILWQHKGAFL